MALWFVREKMSVAPYGLAFTILLSGAAWIAPRAPSTGKQTAQQWQLVEDWPRLPTGVTIGQVSGVAIDTSGHVMVFHRAGGTFDRAAKEVRPLPTVFEVDPVTGSLLHSWGGGLFVLPHSITVDRENNIWLTDDIRHQAMKFSHEGKLLLTVGRDRVPDWDPNHFNEPTDVAVAADGSFYVSDGYRNSRVAQFLADGTFLREWGAKGTEPGQFNIPHGLALDARGNVYVADRENSRLQVFDPSGTLLRVWPATGTVGRVFDVSITPKGYLYIAVSNRGKPHEIRILDGDWHEVGTVVADSTVLRVPHQIAVQGDTVIYVADTNGQRILKYIRR